MEKLDLKKKYKELYKNKKIKIIDYPELSYLHLEGEGAPASEQFQEAVGALFAIAYTISMSYKGDFVIKDFQNFVVAPLEGEWDLIDYSIGFNGNKDNLKWKIMIAMPEFVTSEVFSEARDRAFNKKGMNLIQEVELIKYPTRTCCIALHIGSYDLEDETFNQMEEYVATTEYKRALKTHREIYLSDFRKVAPEKLKTILCFDVTHK